MITKNELKYYSSLLKKKVRDEENKFIVEGIKIVSEGLQSGYNCEAVLVTNQFIEENKKLILNIQKEKIRLEILNDSDFSKLTDTITPQGIAAVFSKPILKENFTKNINSELVVCLDNISDPGNLGTIIRNCDWFGIKDILLVNHCADPYNSKTIRSCMGSNFHLNIHNKIDFEKDLTKLKAADYTFIYTDTDGENISDFSLKAKTIIVFSNEANGPSENIISVSKKKITIPKIGKAESLNVASASAVILNHLTKKE